MTAPPLLEVRGLTKRFGGLVANEDVSFAVAKGEIVGLIGPNGAGKTTVFNSLAGFFAPTSGEILLDGAPIGGLPPEAIAARGVARTFQIVRIFKSMTVRENVMVGAMLRHRAVAEGSRRAGEALEFTRLSGRGDEPAGRLTVAEQKRLELTRALATEPKLLLLDEVMAQIVKANVDLLPQAYTGSMERMESDRVVLDLVLRGFPADRIWCFYDAAQLGEW